MPLPISSVVKTSTSHIKTEFSDFVLVNEFLLPLKGESFSWDAEKNDWAPRGISVEYEYHPDEPGDQSQLYLAHYGISEPSTPNYKVADFGRGTSLLKWLAAAGFVVLLLTSIFAWRRKLRV